MLEIKIEQPFGLRMEVVETDDRVPSMRIEAKILIEQFQHTLSYRGLFWIECAAWSRFVNGLHDVGAKPAVLNDMSDYFSLKVSENPSGKMTLSWEFRKSDVGGCKQAMAAFSSAIDDAMLSRMLEEFAEFPAWW